MSKTIYLFAILIFVVSCKLSNKNLPDILIENVNIVDAGSGLQENQNVLIRGNRIVLVEPYTSSAKVKAQKVIDGAGKYLIPGLWDAHVHFAYIEEMAPSMFDLFLRFGVTSVRDTGGKIEFVKEWQRRANENPHRAPRVMIAGPLLDGMPNVYDGGAPSRPELSVGSGSVEQVEQLVERLDSIGVDLLKAYEMLTPDQFNAITKLARAKGLKVTGHVPLSMDVISASNAGMNSMEHLRNLEMSCAKDSEELLEARNVMLASGANDPGGILRSRIHRAQRSSAIANRDEQKTKEVLTVLARNKTWQIPTLALISNISTRPFTEDEWQETFQFMPEEISDKWKTSIEQLAESEVSEESKIFTQWALDMTQRINNAEIGIMAGTDCPIFFLTPGRSLHRELEMLVEAGLTPLEALEAATVRPAQYFNLENELGLIKEGMIADLLLLNANPLVDIVNTLSINTVIKDGAIYKNEQVVVERE